MKTKNIFRMLLVAVTLLLGANNAMAEKHTISQNVTGSGTVTTDPSSEAEQDETVTVSTTPDIGFELTSLIVRDSWYQEVSLNNNTFVMPDKDVTVFATFTAIQYGITINSSEHGIIKVNGNTTATYGSTVYLEVKPDDNYELESFSVLDANNNSIEVSGLSNPNSGLTFIMPASDVTISTTFVAKRYKLTWQTWADNQAETYHEQMLPVGEQIVEPETPTKEGYQFNGWNQHAETMPAYDLTITGNFYRIYQINLVYDSSQGSATLSKETSIGNEEIQLTVTPNDGFEIESVTVTDANGAVQVWGNYQFRVNASDVTVTITFRSNVKYNINVNQPDTGGSIWVDKQTAAEGETITVAANPWDKYEIESFYYTDSNDNRVDITSSQFQMPASDIWLTATFKTTDVPEKARVNMSYTPSNVELTLGNEFTAPTLSIKDAEDNDVTGLTITYGSSNESVATVAEDGTVTINAVGSTTITASFAGNDTYEAASASYDILVKKPQRQITPGENETIIWNGTPEPTHPGEWNLLIDNSTNWVANTKDNSKIRIYVDNQEESDWKLWAGTYGWQNANWANWPNSDEIRKNTEGTTPYNAEGMYFEFTFSESTKAAIANGLAISFWGQDIVMVTHITEPDAPTYEISAPKPDHGNITVNQSTAIEGADVTFTVKPDAGYRIESVTVTRTDNDETVSVSGAYGTYTFTMPASDVTVLATFTAISYTVTIEDVENGTVTADKSTATIGETVSLTVTPDHGYELASIVVKDEANNRVNVAKDHSFTMPASNVTVTATFSKIGYKVNFEITGEGTVTADQNSYGEGETAWITATPETGYSLYTLTSSPSVEFTSYGNGRYSFTMPASPVTINATFTINTWTITYYVDGEFYHAESYDYGETITPLGNLADREDAHFSGWSDIPETMPDHDVSIYAYYSGFATAIINSSTGYASFSSVKPLDFSEVEGLKAYIVVDADVEGMVAHLKEVTGAIAAKTGLILKGTKDKYEIPTATTAATSYNNNMLVAVSSKQTFSNNSGVFLLVERNGVAMFAEANSGIEKSVEAGHAYLQVSNAGRAQGRYLRFVGDDTTGISDVKASLTSDEVIYNLRGQRVEKPNKGLYIINGKKVILK